jgi:hypothetical protein
MIRKIPDIEYSFPVSLQFGTVTHAATLTLNGSAWWHNYADHDAGEPEDERPWHVTLHLRLDGLPLVSWGGSPDKKSIGVLVDYATADEAETARNRAFLKVLAALFRAGYITAAQLEEAIMGADGGIRAGGG